MMDTAVMFSGAAGTSVGARQAGARIVWAANHKPVCVDVHAANFPDAQNVCQDLHLFNHAAMAEHDLLLASPVCRAHSRAGRIGHVKAAAMRRAAGRHEGAPVAARHNAMRTLVWSVIDALEVNRPRAFVIENVPEFKTEWLLYSDCLRMIRKLGYKISEQVLDSVDFGVPQSRARLFVVGTLDKKPIRIRPPRRSKDWTPTPMHGFIGWEEGEWLPFEAAKGPGMRAQLRKAASVLGDRPGAISLVSHRPVFPSSEPMRTMTTKDQFRWVYRGRFRYPTARESFRLMGFPEDYILPDHVAEHRTIAWAMAGDAVSPPVMRAIVKRIAEVAD
jgi:DNA (cytosine-5)-methyltransferase 1